MEYNPKPREVWCPECKVYTIREEPEPKCPTCLIPLIKVIYSLSTGLRITGSK